MAVAAGLLAVLVALLAADRVAAGYAEDWLAARIGSQGFAARPQVTIMGFPFLTQAAARRLGQVMISAGGRKLGPVEVKRLDLTLSGVRLSTRPGGATAATLTGTALIGFAGLAGMGGLPGLTVSADGPGELKITASLGPVSGTATARVSRAGPGGIRIAVISAGGIPLGMLGSLRDITLPLPGLPPGTTVQSVSVSGQGVLVQLTGQQVRFGGSTPAS